MPFFSVGFSCSLNLRSEKDPALFFRFLEAKKIGTLMLAKVNLLPEGSEMSMANPSPGTAAFKSFPRIYLGFIWLSDSRR